MEFQIKQEDIDFFGHWRCCYSVLLVMQLADLTLAQGSKLDEQVGNKDEKNACHHRLARDHNGQKRHSSCI